MEKYRKFNRKLNNLSYDKLNCYNNNNKNSKKKIRSLQTKLDKIVKKSKNDAKKFVLKNYELGLYKE